ncbi:MAG TPA: regulator of amino acid metabolism, contains ACT domain protein [Methanocorpusculum sp.]|nr:regulator of amino acid metabolism, contains ACT domain protein [Methanocorpusculum sp.]
MWQQILDYFADSPSQQKVVRFILENGISIGSDKKPTINGIELGASALSRSIGVDRRVVDTALRSILQIQEFRQVFSHLRATPDLTNVAKSLGLSVITIFPKNAEDKNIVSSAVGVISAYGLTLRQIFVTDPYTTEHPKLVLIIDGTVPAAAISDLRNLPTVESITL